VGSNPTLSAILRFRSGSYERQAISLRSRTGSKHLTPGNVIRQKKGVSAGIALRFQFCFGVLGHLLIRLQGQFDSQKAYHSKNGSLRKEVRAIA
jgi:plasmid maintenance system antidote protein VapI